MKNTYAIPVHYRIVQEINGKTVVSMPTDIVKWAHENNRSMTFPHHDASTKLRPELRFEPRIEGLCGPMYDGDIDGIAVVRYEDQATYNSLSI